MNTRVDLTWSIDHHLVLSLIFYFFFFFSIESSSFFNKTFITNVHEVSNSKSLETIYDKISPRRSKNIQKFFNHSSWEEETRKYTIPWNVLTSFTKLSRRFKSFPLFSSPLSATRINSTSLVHETYLLMNINDRTDVTGKSTRVGIVDRAQRARGKLHN